GLQTSCCSHWLQGRRSLHPRSGRRKRARHRAGARGCQSGFRHRGCHTRRWSVAVSENQRHNRSAWCLLSLSLAPRDCNPRGEGRHLLHHITQSEWDEFVRQLGAICYWKLATKDDALGNDGAEWILEGIRENRYHLVNRWSPESGGYREACLYLLKLSKFNPGEIYWLGVNCFSPVDLMNEEIRDLFPITKNYVYLNHAAVAPLPQPVYEAMEQHISSLREQSLVNWQEWGAAVRRVRELSARLINAQPREIAFAPNTSSGLAMIANGVDWRAGDNVVSADCEFPANVQPWMRLRQAYGVEVRRAKERDGRLETEEILGLIDDRTRVVALSFVEFASGFRNDLTAIGRYCRERDVLFVVDAIQGLGALRLDVERDCIDALSADAHKFL